MTASAVRESGADRGRRQHRGPPLHGCGCFAEDILWALDLEGCELGDSKQGSKMLATAFKGLSVASSSSVLGGRPCQPGTTHRPLPLQRSPVCPSIEAAHKKGGGSTKNGRCGGSAFWTYLKGPTFLCCRA